MLINYIIVALAIILILCVPLLFFVKKKLYEIKLLSKKLQEAFTTNQNLQKTNSTKEKQIEKLDDDRKQIIKKAKIALQKKEAKIAVVQTEVIKLKTRIVSLAKYEKVVNLDEIISKKKRVFIEERNKAIIKLKQKIKQTNEKVESTIQALQAKKNIVNRSIELKENKINRDVEKTEEIILLEKKDAKRLIREQYNEAKKKHEEIFLSTSDEAANIITRAEQHAERIGGIAFKAVKEERQLDKALKAMKNQIKGYGEEYLLPGYGLLDELADEYDFRKAGQELKKTRECIKLMIKNKTAATCDYVEVNRKHYAMNFVLDAFNGKVESILSKVRHDNYGKLKQQIFDTFNLVNHNGSAFRSARINQLYLDLRLEELKWAVAAHELRLQDRSGIG